MSINKGDGQSTKPKIRGKICMVVHAHYPIGETRVERQAKALVAKDFEVDVICVSGSNQSGYSIEEQVEIYRLPVRRKRGSKPIVHLLEYITFLYLVFFKLSKLHFHKQYNLIQVHNLPDFLVFSTLIPKFSGTKIVLDIHDLMPEFYAERFQKSMKSTFVRIIAWQERLSCSYADHVITVTELWRQTLIKRGQPSNQVSVVMNLADRNIFEPRKSNIELDNKCFRLFYHGSMG